MMSFFEFFHDGELDVTEAVVDERSEEQSREQLPADCLIPSLTEGNESKDAVHCQREEGGDCELSTENGNPS